MLLFGITYIFFILGHKLNLFIRPIFDSPADCKHITNITVFKNVKMKLIKDYQVSKINGEVIKLYILLLVKQKLNY